MIKTLTTAFAAAALVCGQVFAADYLYTATDKTEQDVLVEITSSATPISSIELTDGSVLTVQARPRVEGQPSTIGSLTAYDVIVDSGTATLCVDSTNVGKNATYFNSLTLAESGATLEIDLTANSLQTFEEGYMGEEFNDVYILSIVLTQVGMTGAEHITLSDNAITALAAMGFSYVGYASDTDMFTEALSGDGILKAGEIALMDKEGLSDALMLVGKKGAAPTPEPATATLSLLALAGLSSRRRRK